MKSVGSYTAKGNHELKDFMHPQAIEERYERFSGTIRYVIPTTKLFPEDAIAAQGSVLKRIKAVDVFVPYANNEKSDDK